MQFSKDERQVFDASTIMVLGDDSSTLFWEDKWLDVQYLIVPDLLALIPRRPMK
jgi:hypothetical protein